jgi:hypothetical protein
MIALHNSHTLLFLSITLHARCRCIVTFIPNLIAFPHCDPTAFTARRPQPLLLTNPAPASDATRAVVLRHLRNFACTLREVEYISLSQKTLHSTSSFPSQTDVARLLLNSIFSLTNLAARPLCGSDIHTSYTACHNTPNTYSCAEKSFPSAQCTSREDRYLAHGQAWRRIWMG